VTFEDRSFMRRRSSVDFTLPLWAFQHLSISGTEPAETAVPITLLAKGALVNFNLSDEGGGAVPLLTGSQAGALAEMALLSAAELILPLGEIPLETGSDIRQLANERDVWAQLHRRGAS
jgi:hypothetical protein